MLAPLKPFFLFETCELDFAALGVRLRVPRYAGSATQGAKDDSWVVESPDQFQVLEIRQPDVAEGVFLIFHVLLVHVVIRLSVLLDARPEKQPQYSELEADLRKQPGDGREAGYQATDDSARG